MPLFLVTGRANAGKTGVLYDRLAESSRIGLTSTLLLPVAQDVRRATAELADRRISGARVAVLDGWIEQLWALYGDGKRVVGEATRVALVSEAVAKSKLVRLAQSSTYPGFAGLMADVVRRLIEPVSTADNDIARETRRIVTTYRALLADAEMEEPAIVAQKVGRLAPDQGGPVVVNRFTDLSPAQEAFLIGLAGANDVAVSLPWEQGFPATEGLGPLVTRLSAVAHASVHVPSPQPVDALGVVEREIYQPKRVHPPSAEVTFAIAAGDESECALAAHLASEAVLSGVRPERIAVVFRDAGRRIGLLAAAFSTVGLRVDFDTVVALSSTALGQAFLGILDACSGSDSARERLLAWALSPYSGADPGIVASLDREWRQRRPSGEALLSSAVRSLGNAGVMLGDVRSLAATGLTTSNVNKWKDVASAMLGASAHSRGLGGLGGALDAGAHRAVVTTLEELSAVESRPVSALEITQALRCARVTTTLVERNGAVQVADAPRVRGRRFDVVILGGLTADEFGAERQEPLATALLADLGVPSGTDETLRERLLFYLLVSRARRKLVLLHQGSDARGEALRPSVFWDDVLDLFRDPSAGDSAELPPGSTTVRLGVNDLARAAPAYRPGRSSTRTHAAEFAPRRTVRGQLTEPSVLSALADTVEFSVTELEAYGQCPYRWFYERAARPRELDRDIDARERGSRAHRILHDFYHRWQSGCGITRVLPDNLGHALDELERVGADVHASARLTPTSLSEELSLARVSDWARAVVSDDATLLPSFQPAAHELGFGLAAGTPVEVGGVAVRGSIDRVERSASGVLAIDYKSSSIVHGHRSFETHALIQAPVYALAASQVLQAPVLGGVYRSLRGLSVRGFYIGDDVCLDGRGSSRDALTEQGVAEVLEKTAERVVDAAAGIHAGNITPRPARRFCAHCGARFVCGEAK